MKVAYLLYWNEGENSGVFKKVVSQIRIWKSQGVSVSLHIISKEPVLDVWQKHLQGIPATSHYFKGNVIKRLKALKDVAKAVKSFSPNLVYQRYSVFIPPLLNHFHAFPVILEINTDDYVEYCLIKRLKCWYNRLTRGVFLRSAAGFSFVTHELSQSSHFKRYRKPFVVIANGIPLENYSPLSPPENQEPRLIFLGTGGQTWQGVDKIARLAEKIPKWHFDIVGITREQLGNIPSNVTIYGPLNRQDYEPLLRMADVAFSTMALHRKKMGEACPLKTREYLAFGLPVIVGYKDTDFFQGTPFILELPNTEDNIDSSFEIIKNFLNRWKGKRVPKEAISYIDINIKEVQRLAFFRDVLGKRGEF